MGSIPDIKITAASCYIVYRNWYEYSGLIMQQICMNKFVSPTTGATISSAQFGILLALLFLPTANLWGLVVFSFATAIAGTLIFV